MNEVKTTFILRAYEIRVQLVCNENRSQCTLYWLYNFVCEYVFIQFVFFLHPPDTTRFQKKWKWTSPMYLYALRFLCTASLLSTIFFSLYCVSNHNERTHLNKLSNFNLDSILAWDCWSKFHSWNLHIEINQRIRYYFHSAVLAPDLHDSRKRDLLMMQKKKN